MLNVNRLRLLVELSRRGTLTAVARAMNYSQSAVSQQLAALEREAGVKLLEPVGRRVRLTAQAEMLVQRARVILEQLEAAEADLAVHEGDIRGTVKVGSFQSALLELAPVALSLLADSHPQVVVALSHQEVEVAHRGLLSYEFDLVLGEEFPGSPQPMIEGVHRMDFLQDPLRLAVARNRCVPDADRGKSLFAYRNDVWAMDQHDSRMGAWTLRRCREAGFEARVRFESPDQILTIHLVRTGHATAFVPSLISPENLAGVDIFDLSDAPCRTLYTEVRTGQAAHPSIGAVRTAFAEAALNRTAKASRGVLRNR